MGDEKCKERGCQRERGHRGLHMARTWDSVNCQEIIDEWGAQALDEWAARCPHSIPTDKPGRP